MGPNRRELSRGEGNVQRDPTESAGTTESANSTEFVKPTARWLELEAEFKRHALEMGLVNQLYPTSTRRRWSETIGKLWAEIGAPGQRSEEELLTLREALFELQHRFVDENTAAFDAWFDLVEAFDNERSALMGESEPEFVAALEILEETYARTEERMERAHSFLVTEDLLELHHMLASDAHLERGLRVSEREAEQQAKLDARFEPEDEGDGPGALGVVWSVVGWDSRQEFAADVALTILTAGLGKLLKVVVKGTKTTKRLRRLAKLRKTAKLRNAKRLKKVLRGAAELARAVDLALAFEGEEYWRWVRREWKRIARSYATDELGAAIASGATENDKTLLERVSKESVATYVSGALRISSADEKQMFRTAVLAFAVGDHRMGTKFLQRYFVMNLKRRLATNTIYYSLSAGLDHSLGVQVVLSGRPW